MVERDPRASTRRIESRLDVVWRTLHTDGIVKHLVHGDFAQRLEFYKSLSASRRLRCYIVYTDEEQFHSDSINNTRSYNVTESSYHCGSKFKVRFFVGVWCVVLDPFNFEGRRTGEVYPLVLEQVLPQLV